MIGDRQAAIDWLVARHLAPPVVKTPPAAPQSGGAAVLDDEEVLRRARTARNGTKFVRLWAGDVSDYASESEADSALCWILAFWTRDADQIERLVGRSELGRRDKWLERSDYRESTIANALAGVAGSASELGVLPIQGDGSTPTPPGALQAPEKGRDLFSVQFITADDIRPVEWLWDNWFERDAPNSLTGVGGAGKGTIMSWIIAALSRGALPGCYLGEPIRTLIIGSEDDPQRKWGPRIIAADGDLEKVGFLRYDQRVRFVTTAHVAELEAHIRRHGFSFVYLDQVVDHFDKSLDAYKQPDVRFALEPLRDLGVTSAYAMHPTKGNGRSSLRDRAANSAQFTDVARSNLWLGYHPELRGYRALARGKANSGKNPPAMVFRIEETFVVNPKTREAIEVGTVSDVEHDPGLDMESIPPHPPGPEADRELAKDIIERVARDVGADGQWRPRRDLADACEEEGVPDGTFSKLFPKIKSIEIESQRGVETPWRLKP
jgi:hypothetical protein